MNGIEQYSSILSHKRFQFKIKARRVNQRYFNVNWYCQSRVPLGHVERFFYSPRTNMTRQNLSLTRLASNIHRVAIQEAFKSYRISF